MTAYDSIYSTMYGGIGYRIWRPVREFAFAMISGCWGLNTVNSEGP